MADAMKIFSGSSNPQLAKEIAQHLGCDLAGLEIKKFSDQEISIKIVDNVRGADVFVVQSTCFPANDNIIELCLIMDAFRRASARRINVVIPYFGYGRQDRKVEPRVPISAKVISSIIERGGANRLICMDLHADQIQGFFDIPVDHLYSAPILIDYFQSLALSNLVIVSPDSGGAERARFFAKHLDATMAIIDKRREKPNEAAVMNIVGNVEGKNCIVIDDMIDTAGTICKGAEALRKAGAKSVIAGATHGVLSGGAMENLANANFDQLVITNTIPIVAAKRLPNMKVLSVAPLMGEAILRIHEERSVSSLFL